MLSEPLVDVDDVAAARRRIADVIRQTPCSRLDGLNSVLGHDVILKEEQRQRTGSFKIRGALNCVSRLEPGQRVVAASAGNHAQAVALAARHCGLEATVYVPVGASLPKVTATKGYGAEVIFEGAVVDESIDAARKEAESPGTCLVPPFDHPDVIAGQGTVGLEIFEQAPDAATVVVPVGGGGLIAGVGAALAESGIRVVGVEAAGCASMRASLDAHTPCKVNDAATIADGIAVKSPSALTLAHTERYVDEVVTVSDDAIGEAMVLLLERAKAVVEPSGAAGVAAILSGKVDSDGPIVAILSGGNLDPLLLARLVEHGMGAAGRFVRLEIHVPDRPGGLAAATRAIADTGLNVITVSHRREGGRLEFGTVALEVTAETRGPTHRGEALAALSAEGWYVKDIQT